jgi:Ras-related protein Rab-1A
MDDFDNLIKITVIGNKGVGKSSIGLRHRQNLFSSKIEPTIGAEFYSKIVEFNGKKLKLQVWDKGISSNYSKSYLSAFYKGSEVVLVVFSLVDRSSFDDIEKHLINEINSYLPNRSNLTFILVGSKNDIIEKTLISDEEIELLRTRLGFQAYFSTSSLTGENNNAIFNYICNDRFNIDNYNSIKNLEIIDIHQELISTKKKKCLCKIL